MDYVNDSLKSASAGLPNTPFTLMSSILTPQQVQLDAVTKHRSVFGYVTSVLRFFRSGGRGTQAMRPDLETPTNRRLKNPHLVNICTKLSILTTKYRNPGGITGVRRFFVNYRRRLLSVRQLEKYLHITPGVYSRLEGIWQSFGALVLGHPALSYYYDPQLMDSILAFKIRFIKFFLSHCKWKLISEKLFRSLSARRGPILERIARDGRKKFFRLIESDLTLIQLEDYVKYISLVAQRILFGTDDIGQHEREKGILFSHKNGYPVLSIYGGHLRKYASILCKNDRIMDRKYSNNLPPILATIRSIGRSLPCSSNSRVLSDIKQSLKVWDTPFNFGDSLYQKFRRSSDAVLHSIKAGRVMKYSHISLTSSATFESSQSSGGQTTETKKYLSLLNSEDFFISIMNKGVDIDDLFDVFNCRVTTLKDLQYCNDNKNYQGSSELNLVLYRDLISEDQVNKFCEEYELPRILSFNAGYKILLIASALIQKYGQYDVPPDVIIRVCGLNLPLWVDNKPKRFKPTRVPVRVSASATAGAKTRVITCNMWPFAIIGKWMHHIIEPVLLRSPEYRDGQRLLWSSANKFNNPAYANYYFYSQDLKSSTDYISHQMIFIIWRGFERFVETVTPSHPFLVFSPIIYHPREIFVPEYLGIDLSDLGISSFKSSFMKPYKGYTFLARRGSLMGDPMSFMTLSLVSLILNRLIKLHRRTYLHTPSIILGDDYLTLLPDQEYCEAATRITESLGIVLSTKHGYSKEVGIFAEQVIARAKQPPNLQEVCFVDYTKLRLITQTPSTAMGEVKLSFIGKCTELKKLYSYTANATLKYVLQDIFWLQFNKFYGSTSKSVLPLEFPKILGGLDFPPRRTKTRRFMYKYAHYFEHFETDHPDQLERIIESLRLRHLYKNPRKGLGSYKFDSLKVLRHYLKDYSFSVVFGGIFEEKVFYSRDSLRLFFNYSDEPSINGVTHLEDSLERLKVVSLDKLIDLIDRQVLFDRCLRHDTTPRSYSINDWLRVAKKFWFPRVRNRPVERKLHIDVSQYVKKFSKYNDYFIYLGNKDFFDDDGGASLVVKINFNPLKNTTQLPLIDICMDGDISAHYEHCVNTKQLIPRD